MNHLLQKFLNKKDTIIDHIYKHPNVLVDEFTNDVLEPLLEKHSFEKKKETYSNRGLQYKLNCNINKNTSDYMDILYSHTFFPTTNSPMQITLYSKTLTDNKFYNNATKNIISGNITTSTSDHLTQFLLISNQNPFWKNQMLNTDEKNNLEISIPWLLRKT